ncbi:MAG: RdgB/HAM1 family non-canonical purine NTP pyrophosphatase [Actinobacteria bacterium]|nr:RdgB/HAM1 family non-canonical purine NTP pyrophosphatase [Actinomycetota bacterium]MSW37909.1 RdgB/HAM1 family non-canonical purine NTP pyrophosphatase [Actinomycetota bacterium]
MCRAHPAAGRGARPGVTRLVLASRNAHKVEEMARILADAGLAIEVLGIDAFEGVPEVAETGQTFADNALLKARAVCRATGEPAVADDSGLCVDELNGMPGILSARWAGGHGDDTANMWLLLDQLTDTPDERLAARFRCAVALVLPDGRESVVEGEMIGALVREPKGANGFGYDPIFVPDGVTRTSAELSAQEKDAISHRGNALRALVPVLREVLAPDGPAVPQ